MRTIKGCLTSLAAAAVGALVAVGLYTTGTAFYHVATEPWLKVRMQTVQATPADLSFLLRKIGRRSGKTNYSVERRLPDGTSVQATFFDNHDNGPKERNDRLEIRVIPTGGETERNLPFGYGATDWGANGLQAGDGLRLYLGEDHWHTITPELRKSD